jgi:DNA-directed RNA polymerase specialized sigma24 family protein
VVAARKGDPAAFARIVEHWDPNLRPFVHHVLGGEGSTDRALAATYVRAYRALPRYEADRMPGIWLHRIAYLAATDELRRIRRDPARRRALADAGRADLDPDLPGPVADAEPHIETGAHDPVSEAAVAVTAWLEVTGTSTDLRPGRRAFPGDDSTTAPFDDATDEPRADQIETPDLAETPGLAGAEAPAPPATSTPPDHERRTDAPPPEPVRDPTAESAIVEARALMDVPDHAAPPGWRKLEPDQRALAVMVDLERYRIEDAAAALDAAPGPAADRLSAARRVLAHPRVRSVALDPNDTEGQATIVAASRAELAALVVPDAGPDFWPVLGQRLLAERESPAAATLDPMARLARAHPSEPGFAPDPNVTLPHQPRRVPIQELAEKAEWAKPPRSRRRLALIALGLVAVIALVAAAIIIGTSSRVPDGSVAAEELAPDISVAMAEGPYREIEAVVTEEDATGRQTERTVAMVLANDGSWMTSDTGVIDQTTYDASVGATRRVAVVGEGEGVEVFTTDVTGLSAGAPDPAPHVSSPLAEIRIVPALFRSAGSDRVPRSTVDGDRRYTLTRTLPSGDRNEDEEWRVQIDASTDLPVEIVRTQGERVVRHILITDWSVATDVAADTFSQPAPPDSRVSTTDHGFVTADLAAAPLLGRGEAVTPRYLPAGYELAVVALLADAPAGATSTGDGKNPASEDVLSLGFQRGPERIVVTVRATNGNRGDWVAPFAARIVQPRERVIGDGAFNGTRMLGGLDIYGRAHIWGISGNLVITISGDLTLSEAYGVAATLR